MISFQKYVYILGFEFLNNLFFSAVWLRDLMVFGYSANEGIVLTVSFIRIESG